MAFFGSISFLLMPEVARAGPVDNWLIEQIGGLLLGIISLLGKLLIQFIEGLIAIAQYNEFLKAGAVNTGWEVVRDVCNMFFIIILLVIAFGTILRLENYKYNRLLGTLIIMAILVNFSKFIAGFFIDLGQVIMMTFVNSFKDAAAGNFTSVLKLRQLLVFRTELESPPGGLEIMGALILAVAMLVVALVVILAMLLVFMIRIIMLWILVVLSPLAYLLNVLPMTKQYAQRWWSTFGKWVAVGPVLAFFIWLSLTFLGQGADFGEEVMKPFDEQRSEQLAQGFTEGTISSTISSVSTSENMLGYIIAIAMLIISLMVAQQMGGIAGKVAGNAFNRVNKMGAAMTVPFRKMGRGAGRMAAAPFKGSWELAKMGGRKVRRTWRDSKIGTALNIPAMIRGAKQRGEEIEKLSKDRAEARGREMWDKRPGFVGGGADIVPHEQLVEARYERAQATEVATLQKEQKATLLQKVWNKGGKQAEITRRAVIQSLAAEGHLDDALATDFFRKEAKWTDRVGNERKGFTQNLEGKYEGDESERQLFSSSEITSDFVRSAVSSGGKRSAESERISSGAARTLQDLEDLGKKADHYEYAGEAGVDKETGKLAPKDFDKKTETILAEISKPTSRKFAGMHPHNFSELMMSKLGKQMRITARRDKAGNIIDSAEYRNFQNLSTYAKENDDDFVRFSASRDVEFLGELDSEKKKFKVHDDETFTRSLQTMYEEHPELVRGLERKAGSTGYIDTDGTEYDSLDDFAIEKGWKKPKAKEEAGESAKRNKIRQRQEEVSTAEQKKGKAKQNRTQATEVKKDNPEEAKRLEDEADRLDKEVQVTRTSAAAGEFEDNSAEVEHTRKIREAVPKSEDESKPDDISKLAESIKRAFSEVDKSVDGLELKEFADLFDKSAKNLADVLGKLPDEIKKSLPAEIKGLQQGVHKDQFKTLSDQYAALNVMKNIQRTLEKRQKGNYSIEGITPQKEDKKKSKEKEAEYDAGD